MTSAPVKAFDQEGASPFQANVTGLYPTVVTALPRGKVESNLRRQDQSVTQVNSIRPSLSGRLLALSEP
jgi:hypothetical protein